MNQQKNNIDEIDKILYDYFDNKEIPEQIAEVIKKLPHKKKLDYSGIFRYIATISTVLVLTTGVVFAKDIVKFFGDIFNLNSININNDSVVDAIENKNYIQNIDMDYITLNDNYKIKIDYLMLDDINLYMVFNLYSGEDIAENIRFSIWDLIITDNNGNCYYNDNIEAPTANFLSFKGWKNIDKSNNNIRELVFVMSNGFPNIETLNVKFTKLALYDKNNPSDDMEVNCNCSFDIDINDKFRNRDVIEYKTEKTSYAEYDIEKCIATDTGLYLLYKTKNLNLSFELLDISVTNDKNALGLDNNQYYYMIMQFNISKDELKNYDNIKITDSINTLIFEKLYN